MNFDENVLYKNKEKKDSKTAKQVRVEVELRKNSVSDVVTDTQKTPEVVAEEPEVELVTPEQVLKRSSRASRIPDSYVPSLHYLLLTNEWEPEPFGEALQLEDTTK